MQIEAVEIYSDAGNAAIMRNPGRRFPGVLIQGDSLATLCSRADALCAAIRPQIDADDFFELNLLPNDLWSYLTYYKAVLGEHAIPLPFIDSAPPEAIE